MTDTSTQASGPITMQLGDFVRVKSQDERDWRFMWNSRPYPLPAGGDVLMPFECAALWFGDPRSSTNVMSIRDEQGVVTWVGDRATEVRRLRTKYDNQFGDETQIVNAPKVEVYDLDDNRIYTVLDDPQGDTTSLVTNTVADQATLLAQLQRQDRMIRALMEAQGMDPNADPNALVAQPNTFDEDDDKIGDGDAFDLNNGEGGGAGDGSSDPATAGAVETGTTIPEDNGT